MQRAALKEGRWCSRHCFQIIGILSPVIFSVVTARDTAMAGRKLIGSREMLLQFSFEGAKRPTFSNGKGNRIPYFWSNIPN